MDELRPHGRVARVGHEVGAFLDVLDDELRALQSLEGLEDLRANLAVALHDGLDDRLSERRTGPRRYAPLFRVGDVPSRALPTLPEIGGTAILFPPRLAS